MGTTASVVAQVGSPMLQGVADDDAGANDADDTDDADDVVADLTVDEVIDLRFELFHVRRQLDRLVAFRHLHLLTPDEEETYEQLARRELVLLVALVGQPHD